MSKKKCCKNCLHAQDSIIQYPKEKYVRTFPLVCNFPLVVPQGVILTKAAFWRHDNDGQKCELFKPSQEKIA